MSLTRKTKAENAEYDKSLTTFLDDLETAHQGCDSLLLQMEGSPEDEALLGKIFQTMSNIETDLNYIGLIELIPMIHALEDILDSLRLGEFPYDSVLGDLILLTMDLPRLEVNSRLEHDKKAFDVEQIDAMTDAIKAVAKSNKQNYRELVRQAVLTIDPDTALDFEYEQDAAFQIYNSEDVLYACGITIDDDIRFFMRQAHAVDERSKYWQGRSDRVLQQTLMLNTLCNNPVHPDQLAVAVLNHETALAYLPLELLHKSDKLSKKELKLIHDHPIASSRLLKGLGRWEEARQIIAQHHEHEDGSGYPNGLSAGDICAGAKMLAITDAFEACTHNRAYITRIKRPILRATLKLQHYAGTQFDKQYVSIFTQMIRKEQNASRERVH